VDGLVRAAAREVAEVDVDVRALFAVGVALFREPDPDRVGQRILTTAKDQVAGGGKAFVAGTDISQFQSFRTPEDGLAYEKRLDDTLDRLERLTKPAIAQIEGVAAGGGCAIAICCDLRVATPESTFGIPVARTLGNCLSGASYSRLVDLVGPGRVKDIMFTGRFVAAPEAHAFGLVNRIVPGGEIATAVHALAIEIASNAPLTIRATKEMLRRIAEQRRLAHGADCDLIELCYTSADFRNAVQAFLKKEKPQWSGR
jgi:enoyl-CoA hydratase/carnithine racemase